MFGVFILAPIFFAVTANHFDVTAGLGYADTIVLYDRQITEGPVGYLELTGKYKYFDVRVMHSSSVTKKDAMLGTNTLMVSKTWRLK